MRKIKYYHFIFFALAAVATGCKKLIEIDPPTNTITTPEIFSNNTQAEWTLAAVYTKMIHGNGSYSSIGTVGQANFGAGLSTLLGSLSSDELYNVNGIASEPFYYVNTNKLSLQRSTLTAGAWSSAYKTIYDANAVIEGIAASKPGDLLDSVKRQLTGEALALRSLAYFYLVNFFGDVPLALTIDYSKTIMLSRSPVAKVYDQIITDLTEAKSLLVDDFSVGKNERVRINRWFAEALLARVYLYAGKNQDAVNSATAVINKTEYFSLEQDLTKVFSAASREAIFQLKPNNTNGTLRNATPEGYMFLPTVNGFGSAFTFTQEFLNAFDVNDQRKTQWMLDVSGTLIPYKYIIGGANATPMGVQPQYYMVMRLAEMYLIRAEASLLVSDGNKDNAIADLNALRERAGVDDLPTTLTAAEVADAIANERRFELFAEWGHRWFDLKRTGKASSVLSQIPIKQPWAGDYQLLYPIPLSEIDNNKSITQNPIYDTQ